MKILFRNYLNQFNLRHFWWSAIFVMFGFQMVSAMPLAEYREKIEQVRDALTENSELTPNRIVQLRQILPVKVKIEIGKISFEANNLWFNSFLDSYGKPQTKVEDKQRLREETIARLSALIERLNELEAAEAAERSKDQDKQKMAEILKRAEFSRDEKEKSVLERWLDAFYEWLDGFFPKNEPVINQPSEETIKPVSQILRVVIIAVAIAIIAFVLWRFIPFFLARDRKRRKEKSDGTRVVLGETLREDQSSADLLDEAESLAKAGNIRAAIRKGYIALLCELSDRKVLGLARHKTNRDYLRDVRSRRELYEMMKQMTNTFERTWYGFVFPDAQDWEDFRANFQKTVNGKQ
jgi:hypothetical protein